MKTITLTFTEQETGVLMAVLDAGVKAAGVQAVRALAPVLAKIDAAIQEAEQKGNADDGDS